jgi:hypothetical protein
MTEPVKPEVKPEPPKVVDMTGKPTDKEGNKTHPRVFEILEQIAKEIVDEPCMGIVLGYIDGGGRVGTKFFYEAGFGHHAISASTVLQTRVVKRWEDGLDRGSEPVEQA